MTETSKKRKRRGSASSKGEPSTSIGRSKRDERKSSDGDAGESHFAAAADEGKIDFAGPSKRDRGHVGVGNATARGRIPGGLLELDRRSGKRHRVSMTKEDVAT
ncbi:hypothetical protein THAOC_26608, partial [Thalassiosira oceanica]